jgi:Ricin-type beta-trefoil lectin domain-like
MGSGGEWPVWAFLAYDGLVTAMSAAGVVCALAAIKPWGRRVPPWMVRLPLWIGGVLLTVRGVPGLVENLTTATGLTPYGLLGLEKEAVDTRAWEFWKSMLINSYFFLDGSSTSNGALAQQWDCNGQPGAVWRIVPASDGSGLYFNIMNANSGKCLEVADSRQGSGAPLQQWDCVGNGGQTWDRLFTRDHKVKVFRNKNSGKVIEVNNSSMSNGARVQQWENKGQPSSYWEEGRTDNE